MYFQTNCNRAVEGDIKGFFDNINHNILIQSLWNRGIRDKRVLKIIKLMLKGGIISPLLANVYLDNFDRYMSREWENKKVSKKYSRDDRRISSMRLTTNLKQCYLIRYADDWVILTDSRGNAEKLKYKAQKYLKDILKLDLSLDKPLITNSKKKSIKFLGVEIKLLPHKGNVK
ncbi:TPA: reverse transcriptase/maturase family protein [Clostridioides difficile]|nr:reverse transcriptase/maturase family protein [Clostridioides difficile]